MPAFDEMVSPNRDVPAQNYPMPSFFVLCIVPGRKAGLIRVCFLTANSAQRKY